MAAMRTVGFHQLPAHARVRTTDREYVVELDVADFGIDELVVDAAGPLVTVRAEQRETEADRGVPFRLREQLEEHFKLPEDAELESLSALYRGGVLEIRATRAPLRHRRVPIAHRRAGLLDPDAEAV